MGFLIFLACTVLAFGQAATLIQSVAVVDPAFGVLTPQADVLISGGKIVGIGVIAQPEDAQLVRGKGRFLMPGLWDMHVHLWNPENQPELYVRFGVTGIRDMGSDLARTSELRRAIEAGERTGPHIVTSGAGIDGRRSSDGRLPVIEATTPNEARLAVDRLFDSGADFIKIFSSLELEPYLALAERARQLRIPFVGHLPESVKIEAAIEMRQASVEHCFGLERAGEIRMRKAFHAAAEKGVRFTPTLSMHRRELSLETPDPGACLVLPEISQNWPAPGKPGSDAEQKTYAHFEEIVRWMKESGTSIMAGTDTGDPFTVPGSTLHGELKLLRAAGLTPLEVLRTATVEPVKFLGIAAVSGSVQPGMFADLVMLGGNPLKDIDNLDRIEAVWVKGRYSAVGKPLCR